MNRAIGIPTSLAILVVSPFLIAGAPKKPEPPAPVEAALTLQADSDTMLVKVRTARTQPGKEATLASEDGLETVTVKPATGAGCERAPMRKVALGGQAATDWCVRLSGIPDRGQVAGTIVGQGGVTAADPATKLSLTVRRRHSFLGLPFVVLGASLLGGLVLAVFSPFLVRRVGLSRLGLLMARNEVAPVEEKLDELQEWVKTRQASGDDDSTLRSQLQQLLIDGPNKAREARGKLREALKEDPLGDRHPLERLADKEASRIGHRIEDFRDAQGEPVVHPADALRAAIGDMKEFKTQIDAAESEIQELKEENRPLDKLSAARRAWGRVKAPSEVGDVAEPYRRLRTAVDEAFATERHPGVSFRIRPPLTKTAKGLASASALELEKAAVTKLLLGVWGVLTVLGILSSLAFAGLTVAMASYEPNDTFGSWQDYFGLISSGLASGAAATVLGLLAPWRSTAATSDS